MKCFIFSEVNGSYSYQLHIIQKNTFREACEELIKLSTSDDGSIDECFIRAFNYNPKEDPCRTITIDFNHEDKFSKKERALINNWGTSSIERNKKVHWLANNYNKMLKYSHPGASRSISGELFLETNQEGWYDWIEGNLNVPKDYYFSEY